AVSSVRRAGAEERPCSPIAVEAEPSVSARWPGLLGDVRDAFEYRDDIDRCARVKLTHRDNSITVEVVLPDGRSAARSVSGRDDVVPALEALLLVPRRSAQAVERPGLASAPQEAASPSSTSFLGARDVPLPGGPPAPDRDAAAPSSEHEPGRLRIELSVVTGARIGDGQTSVGLGALSFLDL